MSILWTQKLSKYDIYFTRISSFLLFFISGNEKNCVIIANWGVCINQSVCPYHCHTLCISDYDISFQEADYDNSTGRRFRQRY